MKKPLTDKEIAQQSANTAANKISYSYLFCKYDLFHSDKYIVDSYCPDKKTLTAIARKQREISNAFNIQFDDLVGHYFCIAVCDKQNAQQITDTMTKYGWILSNQKQNKTATLGKINVQQNNCVLEFLENPDIGQVISLPVNNKTTDPFQELPSTEFARQFEHVLHLFDKIRSIKELER
ncbi:MAG: hypothetical protein ACLRFJ_00675 [Alphaproteobacteria bacterium]